MGNSKVATGALQEGTVIKSPRDNYLVVSVLGSGGFGITYKVTRLSDRKTLALKEYFPDKLCERGAGDTMAYLRTNAQAIETGIDDFRTEAERLRRQKISHPNIVAVDEVFNANNTAYYTMEYIDGCNLRQYIVRRNNNKPISVSQALSVMRPVLQAMALLHQHKITHLDIKHENIILTVEDDGSLRPVIIDFGQSKHYDRKGNATSQLTNAGCSDGFAPPEQYQGLYKFTPQADVYALSATLLYLLTAQLPDKSSEITAAKIIGMLDDSVPERIKNAIVNGMRRDVDDRTQSVEQLADSLGVDIADHGHEGNVTRLLNIGTRKRSQDLSRVWKTAAVALVCGGLAGGIWWYAAFPDIPAQDAPVVIDSLESNPPNDEMNELSYSEENSEMPDDKENLTEKKDDKSEQKQPDKSTTTPEPTDDELFAQATSLHDFQTLANKGYAKAYAPLADRYFATRNYAAADTYARKALAANSGRQTAIGVINKLDVIGYYDNGEHGGKPNVSSSHKNPVDESSAPGGTGSRDK